MPDVLWLKRSPASAAQSTCPMSSPLWQHTGTPAHCRSMCLVTKFRWFNWQIVSPPKQKLWMTYENKFVKAMKAIKELAVVHNDALCKTFKTKVNPLTDPALAQKKVPCPVHLCGSLPKAQEGLLAHLIAVPFGDGRKAGVRNPCHDVVAKIVHPKAHPELWCF